MMKKLLFLIPLFALLLSCRHDPEPNVIDYVFTDVKADASFTSCDITCQNVSIQCNEAIHARLLLSLYNNLHKAEVYPMVETDSCLSCHITDLRHNCQYYFTFEVYTNSDFHRSEEIFSFSTDLIPSIVTGEVTEISCTTAKCSARVIGIEGVAVTRRGICWGTQHNPTKEDTHLSNGNETGEYSITMTNLTPGTQYFARAFVITSMGTEYGGEVSFVTQNNDLPNIVTGRVTDITPSSAIGHGEILSEGISQVIERGVCWSTEHDPSASDSHHTAGSGLGSFSVNMSGLLPNVTYYMRAYAINAQGTAYGAETRFIASQGQPEVETSSVSDITEASASGHGYVISQGGSAVFDKGLCWSTQHNPTIDDGHISGGMGMGEFEVDLTGLHSNTTYYLRAYAINEHGTAYGSELCFSTKRIPEVVTCEVTNISTSSAKCTGNVVCRGDAPLIERGICWSTEHNPTIDNFHAHSGTSEGTYSCSMLNLSHGETYFVRAYASNSYGIAYGDEIMFSVTHIPIVITTDVVNIGYSTAEGIGEIISNDGAEISERGICWSSEPLPSISGNHQAAGNGLGSFSVTMMDLLPNASFYVRAYAISGGYTFYGNQLSFSTTPGPPTVVTCSVDNITSTSARCTAYVKSDGGATVLFRGFCWSTNHNPTTHDFHVNHITDYNTTYTDVIINLTPNTTYFVRSFAANSSGLSYGEELSFTTEEALSGKFINIEDAPRNQKKRP